MTNYVFILYDEIANQSSYFVAGPVNNFREALLEYVESTYLMFEDSTFLKELAKFDSSDTTELIKFFNNYKTNIDESFDEKICQVFYLGERIY